MTIPYHDPNNPSHNHGLLVDRSGKPIAVFGASAGPDDRPGHHHTLDEYYKLHAKQWAAVSGEQ
jgi:hypothetical protein